MTFSNMSDLHSEPQEQHGNEKLAMPYRCFLAPRDTSLLSLPAEAVEREPLAAAAAAHLQAWCAEEDTTLLQRPITLLQLKFRTGYTRTLGIVRLLEVHGVLSGLIDNPMCVTTERLGTAAVRPATALENCTLNCES